MSGTCACVCVCVWAPSYIVEYSGPSLHGDALEDSENGEQDVVKLSDAVIRADPPIAAVVASGTLTHATRELHLRGVNCLICWTERCTDQEMLHDSALHQKVSVRYVTTKIWKLSCIQQLSRDS